MSSERLLQVELLDTWHVGSGAGRGGHLDAVVLRDGSELPYVPGRMLRGLLRDACECLMAWQPEPWPPAQVSDLFGSLVPTADRPGRLRSNPGRLRIGDARLPDNESRVLAGDAALRRQLFLSSFQTAIDATSATAADGSLRGVELVVPMTLHAPIAVTSEGDEAGRDWTLIATALPLVRAVGAMKTRGHGRARLTLLDGDAGAP